MLIKQRQKGYSKLTDREKGQYDMLYETFGADEVQQLEDRLFYALGKHPELDDLFKAGKYLDDDALSSMFSRKIDSVLDDFAVRAERLKGAKNPQDEVYSLLDELIDEDLLELLEERKSINDISGGFFTDDMMTVDHEGRLDVLVDALENLQYNEAMATPEILAHNLRGIKAHVNTLPKAQKAKTKKSGTVDDTDFWDEDLGGDRGVQDKDPSDIRFDATYGNVAKEGKYTPTVGPGFFREWREHGRGFPESKDIIKAGKGADETGIAYVERLHAERAAAEQQKFRGQSMRKGDLSLQDNQEGAALMEEAEATIKTIQEELDAYLGITKKRGGGIIDGPLYDRDF